MMQADVCRIPKPEILACIMNFLNSQDFSTNPGPYSPYAITDVIMRGTYGLIEVQIGATWQNVMLCGLNVDQYERMWPHIEAQMGACAHIWERMYPWWAQMSPDCAHMPRRDTKIEEKVSHDIVSRYLFDSGSILGTHGARVGPSRPILCPVLAHIGPMWTCMGTSGPAYEPRLRPGCILCAPLGTHMPQHGPTCQ